MELTLDQAKDFLSESEPTFLTTAKKGYICPVCGNGSGTSGTGLTRCPDKAKSDHHHFKCYKCGLYEDIVELYAEQNGKTFDNYIDQVKSVLTYYGHTLAPYNKGSGNSYYIDKDGNKVIENDGEKVIIQQTKNQNQDNGEQKQTDYTAFFLQANKNISKTDYHRGLTLETLNRYKIGFIENWTHPKAPNAPASPRLIIPTSKYSYLARDTRANLNETQKKYSKSKVGTMSLFNIKALDTSEQPIFIVEGEIDALSIIDVGGQAVGLGSLAMVKKLLSHLEENPAKHNLIIALDADEAGQKAIDELVKGLKSLNYTYTILDKWNDHKDANEALQADREAFTELVNSTIQCAEDNAEMWDDLAELEREAEIKELEKENASSKLDQFRADIRNSEKAKYYPTGFRELDKELNGGLYAGLYFIGAISSLGKTTFCLQIADNIAKSGTDVLIFSLEMARNELIAKSVSRLTYTNNLRNGGNSYNAKTTRGILNYKSTYNEEEKALIEQSITDYSQYAKRIYINEGIGDIGIGKIKDKVARHTRLTGKAPVVLIDYLQILAPADIRATDKQNTDKAVLELKRLSRDFNIPIIGISSFNRSNYLEPVNLASFKESGAIEYSSDVLIGLQFEGMDFESVTKKHQDGTAYQAPETEQARLHRVAQLIKYQNERGKDGLSQNIQVKILKNRNGTKQDVSLYFIPKFNYFYDDDFKEPADELDEIFNT